MKRNQTIKKFASVTLAATLVLQSTGMAVAMTQGELENTYKDTVIEETYEAVILPELSEEVAIEDEQTAAVMPELGGQKPVENLNINTYEATNSLYDYEVINGETIKITKYKGTEADVEVPSTIEGKSVTEIGGNAFRNGHSNDTTPNTTLVSVIIPEGVTKIDGSAFYLCTSLTTVTLPETLTTFGNNIFYKCTSLTTINIPQGITSIGNHMFYGCTSLENINLPESIATIGNYAFWGCTSLKEITLTKNITTIGERAFQSCTSLTEIIVPENVTTIGEAAFSVCNSLERLEIKGKITEIPKEMSRQNLNLKEVILPEGLLTIGESSFEANKELNEIVLPSTLTKLGGRAFRGCSSLTNIVIPENISTYEINSNGTTEYGTFENSGLKTITIKNNDTTKEELEKLIFKMPEGVVYTVGNIEMGKRLCELEIDEENIKVVEAPIVVQDTKLEKVEELKNENGVYSTSFKWSSKNGIGSKKYEEEPTSGRYNYYTDGAYLKIDVTKDGKSVNFAEVFENMTLQTNASEENAPIDSIKGNASGRQFEDWTGNKDNGFYTKLGSKDDKSVFYGVRQTGTVTDKVRTVGFEEGQSRAIDMNLIPLEGIDLGKYDINIEVVQQGGESFGNIEYSFEVEAPKVEYRTITVTEGENGNIVSDVKLDELVDGYKVEFTITANEGYEIEDVLVDGVSVGANSTYTLDVSKDHTIEAKFKLKVVEPPVVEPPVVNPPSSGGSSGGGGGSVVVPKPEVPPVIESIEKLPTQEKEEIINNFVENVPYTSINSGLTIEKLNELTAGKFTQSQLQELIDNPQLLKELGLTEDIYREQVILKPIENPSFTDVQDTHWANDTIKRAAERGLVAGMPDGSFAPKQELQVSDTFAFLDRVLLINGITEMNLGRSTVEQYVTDTDHWAFASMASVGSKLTESTLMTVSKLGNEPITRGLLAQILFEITNGNLDLSKDKITFVDTTNHSYASAIDYCVQVGLLVGTSADTMSPDKALTRAELMSIVVRLDDMLQA